MDQIKPWGLDFTNMNSSFLIEKNRFRKRDKAPKAIKFCVFFVYIRKKLDMDGSLYLKHSIEFNFIFNKTNKTRISLNV